jgi:hypothetical protein
MYTDGNFAMGEITYHLTTAKQQETGADLNPHDRWSSAGSESCRGEGERADGIAKLGLNQKSEQLFAKFRNRRQCLLIRRIESPRLRPAREREEKRLRHFAHSLRQ